MLSNVTEFNTTLIIKGSQMKNKYNIFQDGVLDKTIIIHW